MVNKIKYTIAVNFDYDGSSCKFDILYDGRACKFGITMDVQVATFTSAFNSRDVSECFE